MGAYIRTHEPIQKGISNAALLSTDTDYERFTVIIEQDSGLNK